MHQNYTKSTPRCADSNNQRFIPKFKVEDYETASPTREPPASHSIRRKNSAKMEIIFLENSIQHGPNAKIGPALYFTGARRPANYRHAACKPIDHGSTPVIGPLFIDFRATGQRHGPHTPRLLSTAFEYFAGKEAADPYQYTENNKNYSIAARH